MALIHVIRQGTSTQQQSGVDFDCCDWRGLSYAYRKNHRRSV